jgi:fluoroquinolone resistance protein
MQENYLSDKTFNQNEPLKKGEYENCIFNNCDFSGKDFSEFKFTECTFKTCNFSLVKPTSTSFARGCARFAFLMQ